MRVSIWRLRCLRRIWMMMLEREEWCSRSRRKREGMCRKTLIEDGSPKKGMKEHMRRRNKECV